MAPPSEPNWFIGWPFEASLAVEAPARVRVFAPEDRHVTFAFLGPVGEARAQAAWAATCALPLTTTEASLGPVALLGAPQAPSAITALLDEGREEIERIMAGNRAAVLEAAGARPDTRRPKAHVTVARIQRKASPIQRRNATDWAASLVLEARCQLSSIALYTWTEDRSARLFRVTNRQELRRT